MHDVFFVAFIGDIKYRVIIIDRYALFTPYLGYITR